LLTFGGSKYISQNSNLYIHTYVDSFIVAHCASFDSDNQVYIWRGRRGGRWRQTVALLPGRVGIKQIID
jgi:hypothetical protein